MESVCRVCMSGSVTLVELFANQPQSEEEPSVAEMLTECVDCEVNADDPLPKQICLTCVIDAKNAFRFKRKCEESHKSFWDMHNKEKDICKSEDTQSPVIDIDRVKIENTEIPEEESLPDRTLKSKPIKSFGSIMSINTPSDSIPCGNEISVKGFSVRMLLSDASHSHHPDNNIFKCPHCPKAFKQRLSLQMHIRIHGRNPYKCQYCQKAFPQRHKVEEHTMHCCNVERPFKCSKCPKSFNRSSNLQSHLSVHSVHKCSYCTKTFARKQDLNYHILVHTGERPHKCPHCSKAFKKKQHVEYHLLTHVGRL